MNAAIILAAGESRRMGQPKQLLPFDGKTMLECVIDAFRSPRVDEIIVVLGHKAEQIEAKLVGQAPRGSGVHAATGSASRDIKVAPTFRTVRNPHYQQGMFTSVQAGLRALPKQATLVMVALCDQPRLRRETVEKLIGEFEKKQHKILIPIYEGRQGHPLLFRSGYAKEILALNESMTLKHFLAAHAGDIARLPVADEGVLIDIDDRETYEREMRRGASKQPGGDAKPTTVGTSIQDVVGRVPSRGVVVRKLLPRRLRRLGATWAGDGFPAFFLTICVQGRAPVLANERIQGRLRGFLLTSHRRYGWWPSCYVIMPDHLHLLVRRGEPSREGMRVTALGDWVKALKAAVGSREIKWQKGFFDHMLRSEESEAEKWEYIRRNPVRSGLVERVQDWAFAGEICYEQAEAAPREGTRPTTQ
jgi:molybdenum cofactor cytidylyltransferase